MKILFDHASPFFLAHGGFQTQIEQTRAALEKIGVEVEYVRWWDQSQRGDIIHYFGRPTAGYIEFAHKKGMKVVVAELHTGLGSRSKKARFAQKALMNLCKTLLPPAFLSKLSWDAYQTADAFVALTSWEATLMHQTFGAPPEKIHVVPNGVEEVFFRKSDPALPQPSDLPPSPFLVCTATITERKRVLELTEAAILSRTPLWVIGKPYSEDDRYYQQFLTQAKYHPDLIRYEGAIRDREQMATIYQQARGFVLLSTMESLSLSALEAAASGCPLLLSDLPWARSAFGDQATYCKGWDEASTADALMEFHKKATALPSPSPPDKWEGVARKLSAIYDLLVGKSS